MFASSRFEFLTKFSTNNLASSNAEDKNLEPSYKGGVADLPFLRSLLAVRQKFLELRLFRFISMKKFAIFKNPFTMIISLPELHLRYRRFILLVQKKEAFLFSMAAAQATENHADE